MNPLCNVRRASSPLKVGSYLAANGAWNRKYVVVAISDDRPVIVLVGRFYADGREYPAKRPRPFQCRYVSNWKYDPKREAYDSVGYDYSKVQGRRSCTYFHVVPC